MPTGTASVTQEYFGPQVAMRTKQPAQLSPTDCWREKPSISLHKAQRASLGSVDASLWSASYSLVPVKAFEQAEGLQSFFCYCAPVPFGRQTSEVLPAPHEVYLIAVRTALTGMAVEKVSYW